MERKAETPSSWTRDDEILQPRLSMLGAPPHPPHSKGASSTNKTNLPHLSPCTANQELLMWKRTSRGPMDAVAPLSEANFRDMTGRSWLEET